MTLDDQAVIQARSEALERHPPYAMRSEVIRTMAVMQLMSALQDTKITIHPLDLAQSVPGQ